MSAGALTLSPAVAVVHAAPAVIFMNERRALQVDCGSESALLAERALRTPSVAGWLPDLSRDLARGLVTALHDAGFLIVTEPEGKVADVYARNTGWLALHSGDPAAARAILARRRVAVLGVGGIGSAVLRHLAATGVGRFFLIDGDRVEASNLNRQYLFGPADLGRAKADAAADAVRAAYPHVAVATAERQVAAPQDLDLLTPWRPDLLICAADSPLGRIETIVTDYARAAEIAWIGGGVGLERGYWGPLFLPDGCPCHDCFLPQGEAGDGAPWTSSLPQFHCDQSFGPSNAVVAGLLARDALVWLLSGEAPSVRRVIDLMSMTIVAVDPGRCRKAAAA